jgi:hypothetical protein
VPPTHPRGTLFSVFRARVSIADLRPIGAHLVAAVETELRPETLPIDAFPELQPERCRLAKTASRSTLGHMTQLVFDLRYVIGNEGGLGRCEIDDLNHWLRHTLRHRGGYIHPIDLVAQRIV